MASSDYFFFLKRQDTILLTNVICNKLDYLQINLFYNQLEGLCEGWNYAVKRSRHEYEISLIDFVWLNSLTDVGIMEHVLNLTKGADAGSELPGLAAAFIRLVPEQPIENGPVKEKVIVSHNTAGR